VQRLALVAVLATASTAFADRHLITVADRDGDDQIVVVNATGTNAGQIARIHRALEQRGMLLHLSDDLEGTLEGRTTLSADLDSIKNAYASSDFETALKIVEEDEKHLLDHGGADAAISLSWLEGWRGMIASAQEKNDDALDYFRAAVRFNPAWAIDKKMPSPKVRSIITTAHREPTETGTLKTVVEPEHASITIDGSMQKPANERVTLAIGYHLVQVAADGKKPHAEIISIADGKVTKLETTLVEEGKLDRAAKLVDETVAAPPGARLERARALSKLTGSNRILMIEGANEDHVNVRLYDISLKKVSKTFSLDGNSSSAAIASTVKGAFDDNAGTPIGSNSLTDIPDVGPDGPDGSHESPWYKKWYVYVGAAAVVGGIFLGYELTRSSDPTMLKGF
jgi:hypothetical protein